MVRVMPSPSFTKDYMVRPDMFRDFDLADRKPYVVGPPLCGAEGPVDRRVSPYQNQTNRRRMRNRPSGVERDQ